MSSDPESREAQEARDAQEAELPGGRRPVVCAEDAGRLDDLPEPDGARATGCPRSVHRAGGGGLIVRQSPLSRGASRDSERPAG